MYVPGLENFETLDYVGLFLLIFIYSMIGNRNISRDGVNSEHSILALTILYVSKAG